MFDKSNNSFSQDSISPSPRQTLLRSSQVTALNRLNQIVSGLEVQFDPLGEIRHLTMTTSEKLLCLTEQKICGLLSNKDPISLAYAFLGNSTIRSLLGTPSPSLSLDSISSFSFGYRVDFKQIAQVTGFDHPLSVRGGALNIAIDDKLQIFNITSTLRHGLTPAWPAKIISQSEAIKAAAVSFGQQVTGVQCQLMLSSHRGRFNPLYEVTLSGEQGEDSAVYLVLAETGEIVHKQEVVLRSLSSLPAPADTGNAPRQQGNGKIVWLRPRAVPASALLQTPEASKPIAKQVSDTIIKGLPKANILANQYFVLLIGNKGKPVCAKPDGSFCYQPGQSEFAAVTTFISLNSQIALYLELGLKIPERPLLVFVDDAKVIDNAYFNPDTYELHIGVGSGLKHTGLNKHMSFDLGIANHEFAHNVVYLQTPSHDLRGIQGSAIHEAIGDVLGTLVMHYLVKLWYAKQFACPFTAADIKADQRLIGSYAAAPQGIRSQKNSKRMPDDFVAEAHDDGLIIGGAMADLLVYMATKSNGNLESQIRLFVRITLMALALVPAHKVTFSDLLRAFLTADRQISKGLYRENIERCFARHGITLTTSWIGVPRMKALAA